jgi:Na+-driven multidrug efflux pump
MYLIGIPIAFISVGILDIKSVVVVLLLCQIEQVVRFFITINRYRSNKWAIDLTKIIGD